VELDAIQNTDGYLRRMLRNLFVSEMRRSSNLQQWPESMADYDSAELGLRIIDPHTRIQVADELRGICLYACERRETYRGASVLILRFFHGYYPNEIAQILRSSMDSVYGFLKLTRREARSFLDDSKSVEFEMNPLFLRKGADSCVERNPMMLLTELRNSIFSSRRGACLPRKRLSRFYVGQLYEKPNCSYLAHLVSCPSCLDEVNRILKLPSLAERYPTDSLDKAMNQQLHAVGHC